MPKIAREFKALEVAKLSKPGLHMVGTVSGLGLSVSDSKSRSWILRTMIGAFCTRSVVFSGYAVLGHTDW